MDPVIAAAKELSSASHGKYYLSDSGSGSLQGAAQPAVLNEAHAELLNANLQVQVSAASPQWQSGLWVLRDIMEPGVGTLVNEFTPGVVHSHEDRGVLLHTWRALRSPRRSYNRRPTRKATGF